MVYQNPLRRTQVTCTGNIG